MVNLRRVLPEDANQFQGDLNDEMSPRRFASSAEGRIRESQSMGEHRMFETVELRESEFQEIRTLVDSLCGINLHDGKKELVKARLNKRIRTLGLTDFAAYLKYIQHDGTGDELIHLVDSISTNQTYFFREEQHLDFLNNELLPLWNSQKRKNEEIRIWSAGCSSGEEPYSLAIILCESQNIKDFAFHIWATDISTKMLYIAKNGIYRSDKVDKIPHHLRRKYFLQGTKKWAGYFRVKPVLRNLIAFDRINLMDPWNAGHKLDLIFCRNVMIYFEKKKCEILINKFWDQLKPGGILVIGHAESFIGIKHNFVNMGPTIYKKMA